MSNKVTKQLIIITIIGLIGAISYFRSTGPSSQTQSQANEVARVIRVIDGDTLQVEMNGQNIRVRYIGVDAPESTRIVECFGREATKFHRTLVNGQQLRLERDVSETDRFGRLLRYAYLPDGRMVNEILIREGYATARSFPPDVKYQDRLRAAEKEARNARRGLWSKC